MSKLTAEGPLLIAALRADRRSFAAFATLLLALQLLLAGLGLGKAAAEAALFGPAAICSQSETGSHIPSPDGHRECLCLAAGCCQPVLAALPAPAPPASGRARPRPVLLPARDAEATIERRPLALFARAGHSPPSLS